MKILLIEDDSLMADDIALTLRGHGHAVDICGNGIDGEIRARDDSYSSVIVDRMLPGLDGLTLVRRVRADGIKTPVLFLTTMSGIDDRVQGLESGADDYLTKPFAAAELLARVHAITRRVEAHSETTLLKGAGLELDLIRRTVMRDGHPVTLQPQEFRLLEYLLRNINSVLTRAMLLEHVWGLDFDPRTNVVETHMSRLRAKLDCGLGGELISTLRGTGYILRAH